MFHKNEKVVLLIDGANLYSASKNLGFDIDYKQMYEFFNTNCDLMRAYYYTTLIEDQEYSSIRPLIDWLDYNGYSVIAKLAKEFTDPSGRRKVKGNIHVELTVDALELSAHADHFVLLSGDGDYLKLIEALQRRGKRVSVVSTVKTQPPMIADDLRRQADQFYDLRIWEKEFGRALPERTERSPDEDDEEFYHD